MGILVYVFIYYNCYYKFISSDFISNSLNYKYKVYKHF